MTAPTSSFRPGGLLTFALIAGLLYVGREICIPVALAGLLCFLLAPLADRLQKWRLGRIPSAILAVVLGCGFIVTVGGLLAGQLVQFADQLPQYQAAVHAKLQALHGRPGAISRFTQAIDDLTREVEAIEPTASPASQPAATTTFASTDPGASTPATVPVTVPATSQPKPIEIMLAKPHVSGVDVLRSVVLRAMSPLVTLGIVLILTLFMLVQRADLRDRAIRLMGNGQLHMTTRALDEAAERVSRYLLMQLLVNGTFGLCIGVGLFAIGIPFSPLWGLLAGLLRFMPYFGVPAAAMPVVLMALVSRPGFSGIVLVAILFVGLETVLSYVIEPWLYGSKTGISPLAILVSALFWACIWGPPGLLLATPLTVCLAVAGRHVPGMRFLHTLLGDEPALSPSVRLYQRLLAHDTDDAWEMVAKKRAEGPLAKVYDQLLLPAVVQAETNRLHGELDDARSQAFFTACASLVDEVEEQPASPKDATQAQTADGGSAVKPAAGASRAVLCAGVNSPADDLGARMLAGVLRQAGLEVQQVSAHLLAAEFVQATLEMMPQVICLSSTSPHSHVQARYLCKRLRAANPRQKIIVATWLNTKGTEAGAARINGGLADYVVGEITEAAARTEMLMAIESGGAEGPEKPANVPERGQHAARAGQVRP